MCEQRCTTSPEAITMLSCCTYAVCVHRNGVYIYMYVYIQYRFPESKKCTSSKFVKTTPEPCLCSSMMSDSTCAIHILYVHVHGRLNLCYTYTVCTWKTQPVLYIYCMYMYMEDSTCAIHILYVHGRLNLCYTYTVCTWKTQSVL